MSFQLLTFGGLRLFGPDKTQVDVPTDRAKALLLLLVSHRLRALHRETMCAALWPDAADAVARASLRKALWRIRSATGADEGAPLVIVGEHQVGLDASRLTVDAWEFSDLLRRLELKTDAELTDDDASALLQALDLNNGLFGEGIPDTWLVSEQESLLEARIAAMERLVSFHRLKGNLNMAISWSQKALLLDPLREHLHASIIECQMAMGDRALAIRQFKRCQETLKREIGIGPSREVTGLYDRLVAEA